jgi:aminoglycoside 6'-N-acetyltransferase
MLRPAGPDDVRPLYAIRAEPFVADRWGPPEPYAEFRAELLSAGNDDLTVLVVEVAGVVVGAIQFHQESDARYRHAGIDIYLSERVQGRGLGTEAVRVLARYLFDVLGHHRLTIDPAASNTRAIRAYAKVGFTSVGVLRQYEQGADGTYHDGLLMELLRDEFVRSETPPSEPDPAARVRTEPTVR